MCTLLHEVLNQLAPEFRYISKTYCRGLSPKIPTLCKCATFCRKDTFSRKNKMNTLVSLSVTVYLILPREFSLKDISAERFLIQNSQNTIREHIFKCQLESPPVFGNTLLIF
ncbi:uncharacterized protein LOC118767727 [Octopus sinensis]|uniref:Uncharacterized protein LOC118767727 n=1 Tax=Octopus sinensis TaxID=2607531 RepID=A0A7E6FMN6_9MOLL|nr:uncharacterized protein LOC118767727 [Octopus sinensis]